MKFSLYHLNYVLGAPIELPKYITSSKSIIALNKKSNGQVYKEDGLCAFRCLATHYHGREKLDSNAKHYYAIWKKYLEDVVDAEQTESVNGNDTTDAKQMESVNDSDTTDAKQMESVNGNDTTDAEQREPVNGNDTTDEMSQEGLKLHQVAYFEKCFKTNVNIFQLNEDGSAFSVYKSRCHHKSTMNLNMFEYHLSYITNLNAYASKYQCRTCERHFSTIGNMYKHQRICKDQTVHEFPGGYYTAPLTIFDVLEFYDISVPEHQRLFPWFLVYDFEAMLLPVENEGSDKLAWTAKHVPISVSICSNVDGYITPHCIVDLSTDSLVAAMVQYMKKIAERGEELARIKFKDVFDELENMINHPEEVVRSYDDDDGQVSSDTLSDNVEKVSVLKSDFEDYCKQMICMGFNSSKYDMNLIKSHLAKHLNIDQDNLFTVKRNNQYACLANSSLKFLDITSYLSPGINYSKFFKACDVAEQPAITPFTLINSGAGSPTFIARGES